MDYRLKKNRREGFIQWYRWSLENKDCDPAIWMINYIFNRFEFNTEQKLWLCWLYANTYHFPTAYILWNEFPDYELVDSTRITNWNNENYKRLRYQTDTKYNKGHLPIMFESYKKNVRENQTKFFEVYSNFTCLWNKINKDFYKFGRYTAWFYMQALHQCCGLPLTPTSLFLKDYGGSRSHRNGLHLALGQDDLVDKKLSERQYHTLESQALELIKETNHPDANLYTLETCLCSYKKIFRRTNGRYLGYYLDRQSEEISVVEEDGWYGIDWDVLWQARKEVVGPLAPKRAKIETNKYNHFLDSGKIEYIHPEKTLESFF